MSPAQHSGEAYHSKVFVFSKVIQPQQHILAHFPNVAFQVVAIAASAGGLKAISTILSALPANFPAAITVVQHLNPDFRHYTVDILQTRTALRVEQAKTGAWLRPGTVYTSVPGWHLLVNSDGTLLLSDAPKVNFVRPAADLLFWSLATSYQARAIAVVLTGRNSDGALGVQAIKEYGGTVIVQDPATSEYPVMPAATYATGKVDFVLPLEAIADRLINLVMLERVS